MELYNICYIKSFLLIVLLEFCWHHTQWHNNSWIIELVFIIFSLIEIHISYPSAITSVFSSKNKTMQYFQFNGLQVLWEKNFAPHYYVSIFYPISLDLIIINKSLLKISRYQRPSYLFRYISLHDLENKPLHVFYS